MTRNTDSRPEVGETRTYNKLVRDKIPEIIQAEGNECTWYRTELGHHLLLLLEKLIEEATEARDAVQGHAKLLTSEPQYARGEAQDIREALLEELNDIEDVMFAIERVARLDWGASLRTAQVKRREKGGFHGGVVLQTITRKV